MTHRTHESDMITGIFIPWCLPLLLVENIIHFYKLKLQATLHPVSTDTIFPAFAHLMSLCHILVIFIIFQTFPLLLLGKHSGWNHSPWPGTTVTIHVIYFMIGDPGKAQRTNKPPSPEEFWTGQKEMPHVLLTSQNLPHWNSFWLSNAWAIQKDPESEWLARDNLETNPITVKPEIALRLQATSQSSSLGFPYPPALHPGAPSQ